MKLHELQQLNETRAEVLRLKREANIKDDKIASLERQVDIYRQIAHTQPVPLQ